ncbi:MAG: PAS domain S-box protein [Chitinispirillaceae bacterium]|nr:PAS domain S-box protein [Chitinispirillaceae bacterium]
MNMNAETQLIESETRYRRLFESAKDGILILDADNGMVVDVNPFLTGLLGYSKEQFMGKNLWEVGVFKDIAASKASFIELQEKKYVRYENMPLETSDGRKIEVEFVSNLYLVDGEEVIQCNIRDITERKRAEEKIKGQLAELQRWQDVMLGREDRVQELKSEVNELCCRLGEKIRYPSQENRSADSPTERSNS